MEQSFGGEAGIFYFIPLLAASISISPLDAAWYFLLVQVVMGVVVSATAFFSIAKTLLGKCIVLIGVTVLGLVAWLVSDVYITYFFTISFFPWILILLEKKYYKILCAYSFMIGLIVEYGNFVRSFSGLPLLLGVIVAFVCSFRLSKKTLLTVGLIILGIGSVKLHIHTVINHRNRYLVSQGYVFKKEPLQHTFWHAVYTGLGFIVNNKNITFSDSCSTQKVKSLNSNIDYLSPEYELALCNEVINLCLYSPNFVLRVMFAKLGVLFYYLLLFANVGLIAAYYNPKPLYIELSYGVMLLVSALPGLLTIPNMLYLLGFASIATLYGVHSIIFALNRKKLSLF